MVLEFLALIALILASGIFSSSETAFTSLSLMQIQQLASNWGNRGKLIKKITSRQDILITTILIGNNLVNIGASALATTITIELFGNRAVGVMTGVLTLVILIFAEVTPKRIAIINNEFICLHTVRLITILSIVFRPVVWVIGLVSSLLTRLVGYRKKTSLSLEGLLHMVNLAENMGVVENYETRLVKNVFRFDNINLQAIMTHRTEVFLLDKDLTIAEALPEINEQGYSRIPVYDGHPENIAGIILTRDVMKVLSEGKENMPLRELMLKPIFVPMTKRVNEMLAQFKREKLNIAVVLDEYGGLAGVVTQEDVIEELLGELYDEHEEKEYPKITKVSPEAFSITADISLHQLNDALGLSLSNGKYSQTLGGYISEMIGHIPEQEEVVSLPEGNFTIETMEGNKIESIRFIPTQKEQEEEEEENNLLKGRDKD